MKNLTLLVSMLITVIAFGQNQKSLNELVETPLTFGNVDSILYTGNLKFNGSLKNQGHNYLKSEILHVPVQANTTAKFNTFISLVEEIEESLELEDWMTDDNLFNVYSFSYELETEQPLELEPWMTDESLFKVHFVSFETEIEEALELEDWMIDNKYWE